MVKEPKYIAIRSQQAIAEIDLNKLGISKLGLRAVKIAKSKIANGPKTGLHYYNLRNQSSSAGQAPANQSRTLHDSIGFRTLPKRIDGSRVVEIFADTPYAAALELGYSPRNLEPRPYLRPSIDQAVTEFINNDFDYKSIFSLKKKKRTHR